MNFTSTSTKRAKRFLASFIVVAALSGSIQAQLSGTKNIPADYPTLAAAVADINTQGVNGPLIINIPAGFTEIAPTGGYALTATGTSVNTITFQKSGAGANPLLTAYTGTATPGSAVQDGVFRLVGSDYVTIDGIDVTDPNTANPATMEYGYALYKASASDGAQYNTIKNCVITLNRVNNVAGSSPMVDGSVGISLMNATPAAATTVLTATTTAGSNSYNKIYTNTIQNCNIGIAVIGYAASTPFTAADTGNDIGGNSTATGNNILNFGGAAAATNPAAAIRTLAQYALNISYNNVNNNNGSGVNHVTTLRGIYINTATSANATISSNTVSVNSGGTTTALNAIENASGSTAASNTISITNNIIQNCTYSTSTTGIFNGILNSGSPAVLNIAGNTLNNISLAGTGTSILIETGSPSIAIASSNTITAISRTGASGSFRIIKTTSPSTSFTANNNLIDGVSWTASGSTGSVDCIYSLSFATAVTANNNIIRNISTPSTGTINGIRENGSSGNKIFQGNQIYNFSTTAGGAGGATFNGIYCSTGTIDIDNNQIYALNSTGTTGGTGGTIYGIQITGGTSSNIFKNKIYGLSSTSTGPTLSGIFYSGATTNNAYNNLIGNLTAPAANGTTVLSGINVNGGTTANLYYNTVYLNASSSGAAFGTSALYASSSTNLTLNNNILINNSTPAGAGLSVAYRRTSTTLTSYGASSNNNLFYAGTPGTANLIFYDGTTSQQTLAAYKTFVGTRDGNSVTENVAFASTTGSASNFLHINNGSSTVVESGAANIAGITDDFDGDIRQGNTGYTGTGTSPDIGADEFQGTSPAPAINSVSITPTGNQCTSVLRNVTANVTAGAAPITSVTINYSFNGVAQTPITMTGGSTTGTSTWSATIPAATPPNASVTWMVSVTDGTYTKTQAGASYADAPLAGISASASASVNPVCSGSTSTLTAVFSGTTPATYALPPAVSNPTTDEDLGGIVFGPLTNTTAINSLVGSIGTASGVAGSYSNFTAFGPYNFTAGNTYTISLSSLQQTTAYGNSMAVYIDYNRNGVFTDAGEAAYVASTTVAGAHTETASITIPATAYNGLTRMRVMVNEGSITSPTMTVGYGEYEEYMLNISSSNNGGGIVPTFSTYAWTDGTTTVATTNPATVTATSNTTYSIVATDANGCTVTSTPVTLSITPLPAAPTATNSTQCGVGVPTAQVGGGTSYNWYATATSTTVLQSGASTSYTTPISSTTTFYVSSVSGSCQSPRTAVSTTVTLPDGVTASTSSASLCPGGTATLTATQTGTTNPYVFSWTATPAAGSGMTGTVNGATTTVAPTVPGTYVYSVTATDGICTTTSSVSVVLNNNPNISNVTATPTVVCSGGAVNLSALSINATAGTATVGTQSTTDLTGGPYRSGAGSDNRVQYLITAAELTAAGIAPGNITALSFSVTSLGSGVMPNWTLKIGATTATSLSTTFDASTLNTVYGPVGYTAVSGLNTYTFSAPYYWNGTSNLIVQVCHDAVSSGSSYIAMTSSANKTIYTTTTGACTQTSGTAYSTYRALMFLNAQVGTNVTSSVNFVWNPGAVAGSTANVNPTNPGTTPATQVYTVTATNPSTSCSNTATVGVLVNPLPSTPLATNSTQCGVAVPTASVSGGTSYNWYATPTSTAVIQSGSVNHYTTAINSTTTFYVSSFNGTCESPRVAVTTTVTIPDAVTAAASPTSICPGNTTTLTVSQTGSTNVYSFTWTASPAAGSGITGSATGASVVVTPTASGTYVYTVTASDGVCTALSSVNVLVNNVPLTPVVTPTAATSICLGSSQTITAVPGTSTIFLENFETFPFSQFTVTGTGVTSAQNTTYFRQGANSDQLTYAASSDGALAMVSDVNLSTYNSPKLTFFQICATEPGYDYGYVQYSTDGGSTWTSFPTSSYQGSGTLKNGVVSFDASSYSSWSGQFTGSSSTPGTGPATALWQLETIDLSAYQSNTQFRVRFRVTSDPSVNYFGWLLDKIAITAQSPANFAWTSTAGSGLPAGAGTPSASNGTVTVTPTAAGAYVYTVTASNAAGCTSAAAMTSTLTVNPLPVAPTATNSSQCGYGVPTAAVGGSGLYNWYASPTSTTVIQSGSSNTYTTSINSTTTFYVAAYSGFCESATRTAVTASVTIPDAVTAVASSTAICPGGTATLTAVQSGTNNPYVFSWTASPATGSGMPGTVSGASTTVMPTIVGTYVYSVTATDGICTTISSVNVTLQAPPSLSNVTATPSVVCSGGAVNLNATSFAAAAGTATVGTQSTTDLTGGPFRSGAGADNRVQYLITAAELTAAGIAPGNITALSFSVTSLGSGTMPNWTLKIGATSATSLGTTFDASPLTTVYGPSAYTAVSDLNTFTFSTPYNWNGTSNIIVQVCHDAVTSGSSYIAMTSSANKTIYTTTTGACTQTTGTAYSTYRALMLFNAQVGTNVSSSMNWMWNPGAIPTSTALVNPTNPGTTPATQVYTVSVTDPVTTCSNSATASVTVNPLPATPAAFNSVQCGVAVPTASVSGGTSYNWYATPTSTTVLQSGSSATFTSSISNTTTYYVSSYNGTCESPRAAVTASVNVPDAITASASSTSLCPNTSATLTAVNTGTTNNYSYTWTAGPAAGSGIPTSAAGATVSITPTLPGTYVYTVTGVDGVCTAVATTSINVFQALTTPPVASASPNPLCAGATTSLMATVPTSVALGSGSTTLGSPSSGGGLSPYSQYYEGQRTQYLFKASELTAQGLTAGNLASVTFSVTNPATTAPFTNYTMKMYPTTATDLSASYASASAPMTTVFGPATLAAPSAGLNTISFSTPFNWDGTSNVIVDICFENDPSSSGVFYTSNAVVAANTMSYTATRGDYADNSSLCNTSNTGTSVNSTSRPYVVFATANAYTFSWSDGSVVGTSNPQPVTPTVTTTYTATITDSHGCTINSAPVTVTVNPVPSVSVTPTSTSVCAGSPVVLTASGATSYTWTPGTSLTTASVTVSPTVTTTYTVTGASLGCSGTNTLMVTAIPVPTVVTSASSPSICVGGSATLTVSGADTYSWSPGAQTSTTIVVSPTVSTTYSAVGTSTTAGCSATSTISLAVFDVPSLTVTPASPTICANGTVTLTGSGATTYSWSSGSTTNTAVVTPSASTTYTLSGTNACGTTTTTAMVSTVTTPTVTASATSTLLCAGSTATITAGGAATYSWSSGASTMTIAVTPNASTVYTVTGTNACGSATAVASVSVAPIPNVTAVSSRTSICNGDFAVLNGNGATTYTWMPGGANTSSITITPTVTTTYTLTGKSSAGCVNVATVSQLVLPCTGINEASNASGIDIYPNPNVGSVNINIPGELVGHSSIQVFDAIGKLVIKENLTDESTHLNTSRLEEGLYIYKIYDNNGVVVKVGRMVRNK